ncbi:MAG TPA: carboxypeptidase regulatory-like domain-containing protein [Terriglobales bacterium]|nr:carboxypeptidase regulatory-like domain-containing protein [Terriglobales bacterium]
MYKHLVRMVVVALAALIACELAAQSSGSGAISGVITDPSGAVVPDAQVTAKNLQNGDVRTVHSNTQGSYTIGLLQPGDYSVEATKAGFKTTIVTPFTVHTTNTEALNIKFEVGATNESVSVEANAERLQLESASLGHVTTQDLVENLPLVTRNFTEIIGLNPGVSTEVNNAGDIGRGNGGNPIAGEVSVAGTSGMDNNFQMNGVNVDDFQQSGAFSGGIPIPNPDTIREFKVQTAPYDASYGRDAGANVNVVTRTGQNAFHGALFEFLRNEDLNANDYFRNETKQGRPRLRQNQFGGTFGGPVIKDKLLFFTSYQGTRQQNGLDVRCSSTFFEPPLTNDRSPAALGALFAGQPTFWQQAGLAAATGLPGATVAPNGSNISPVALALLNLKLPNGQYVIPTPQTINPAKPFAQQGFSTVSQACPFNEDQAMLNLQWNQAARSTWELRGFRVNSNETLTLNQPQLGGSAVPGFGTNVPNKFRDASLANSFIFTPTLLNHFLLGWHEDITSTTQAQPFQWSTIGASVNSFDILPQVSIAGSIAIGGNGQTLGFAQNTYQLQDDVSWVRGRHNFRFGAGGERYDDNIKFFNFLSGTLFETWPDFLLGESAAQNGTLLSNIILSLDLPGELARHFRALDWNAYAQDDVHISRRLTMNLGFRFERLGDVGELTGRNSNFDFAAANPNPPAAGTLQGFIVANNFSGAVPAGVVKAGNNLALKGTGQNTLNPRIGLAWQLPPSDKVVLRIGYGVYHQRYSGQPLVQTLTNEPWALFRQPQTFANAGASLTNPFAPLTITFPDFIPYSPTSSIGGESFDQNFRPPMVQHYSLNIQDQLAKDTVLEVGYIGSRGTRLMTGVLPNEAMLASASNPIRGVTTNTVKNVLQRVPVEGLSVTSFIDLQTTGQSWYNALEASLVHRTRFGLQAQASYTWAHSLSDANNLINGTNGGTVLGDQYNRHHSYGTDAFVRPQRLVVSFDYAMPFYRSNLRSLRGETLGGWRLTGVYTIQAGQRLTVTNTNSSNVNGMLSDFAEMAPGCITSTSGSIEDRLNNYINRACFFKSAQPGSAQLPYPVVGSDGIATGFGNSRPGVLVGPGENNFNAALIKQFGIKTWTESSNLEFRAEAFNVFNHPQFSNPSTSVSSSAFGTISSLAVNPRVLQLALKFNF